MGLTITPQFVELMGGTIRVESVLGKGSRFRVEVPVEPAEAAALARCGAGETPMASLAPGQPEYKVLIVEDQAENRQLLRQLLGRAGFQVRVAENGAEGVRIFQSWQPQFIWMDWRMPVMDGLEATRRIRALAGGHKVKIAAISASVLKEEQQQVLAAGADDFVPKPIQFSSIYHCLMKHLGVRFVSDSLLTSEANGPSAELDHEALAALPASLRTELTDALVSLNTVRIAGSICRVAELNSALGSDLKQRAGQFQYTAILRALQSCGSRMRKKEAAV